ncbi:uncharacterized protein BP01DRAFT_407226 [Aspergillus saccharolyticus JOP 1030-1]|uniref:Sialidase n=1 Tax=Aspergillus saccharolyticus JOP 1030-1 TaxID=1450539 RepID=A0A318ZCX1_9EURO|nr:hypothetical protein BP01DRAFT_407226 [Aspergillus saccharolyticus JOP 1030-1]PYH41370.1 hypothetical protein BP01DRAFT_407226 [Aspergillus saccharolyticus JOP 1030-1]
MSHELSYYRPSTPPAMQLQGFIGANHSRHASDSSLYSNNSSPWSAVTVTTSPIISSPPRHHHGPALLPKIRPQDIVIEPKSTSGPQGQRRVLSNTRNPAGLVNLPTSRSSQRASASDYLALASPGSVPPVYKTQGGPSLASPVSLTPSYKRKTAGGHTRSVSTSIIDDSKEGRYGYSTCRQVSRCLIQPQGTLTAPITPITPNIVVYPAYVESPAEPSHPRTWPPSEVPMPLILPGSPYSCTRTSSAQCSPVGSCHQTDGDSTTLLSYLTAPTQAVNLVRNVSVIPTRGLHDYFWWDIRNLRSWSSFSLETINSVDGLSKLLQTAIPSQFTPVNVLPSSHLSPDSEAALINVLRDIYAPRVNAALAVSQGPDHLTLYDAPIPRVSGNKNYGGPHFLANYASDTERTSAGLPRGRLVGIVKTFDRWNTGMRNEAPHRRVEYLNGLAHLQRCMREHSCRYGFILTEIELVCVRAGCDEGDDVPYFGFLEVSAPIPTKLAAYGDYSADRCPYPHSPAPSNDSSLASQSPVLDAYRMPSEGLEGPMTASLALYFLLMLSKSVPLPSQPSAHLNVGGPGALTRQRVLPDGKDKWIPEPQIGERRDAKRVRGWVWPQDAWHRREGGGVPRSRAMTTEPRTKKWHK